MEKEMPKISVIVPVYNVEAYIKDCLDTIATQTYPNLEILAVDDASTDKSGRICDAYAVREKRLRVEKPRAVCCQKRRNASGKGEPSFLCGCGRQNRTRDAGKAL